MSRAARAPIALAATASACLLGVLTLGPGPARVAFGGLLVLILPGAALSALAGRSLSGADRLLAGLAGSIATAILTGLALGATHAGLGAGVLAVTLWMVLLGASLLLLLIREQPPAAERPHYACARASLLRSSPSIACFAVAMAVAVLAVVLARDSAARNGERATRIVNLAPADATGESR